MQIIDLTQGKYPIADAHIGIRLDCYVLRLSTYGGPFNKSFLFNSHNAGTIQQKRYCFLQKVPIYLVDTSMSGTNVFIPETGVEINIPLDNYASFERKDDEDEDFFRKLMARETREDNESEDKKGKLVSVIYDYLAVYVPSAVQDDVPARIFVWVDKVCKHTRQKKLQRALLEQVILHEYGHALLDVSLYGFGHTSLFSYVDYPYRYIEEMCANAFSLHYGNRNWDKEQMAFIEKFVKSQPKEYAAGWYLCNVNYDMYLEEVVLEFWMWCKVCLDNVIIDYLDWFWKDKNYNKLFIFVPIKLKNLTTSHANVALWDSCGKNYWEYHDLSNGKIGIVKIEQQTHYVTDAKYDSVWSYDKNGLCMVRIDHHYGYVNTSGIEQIPIKYDYIYSFENGLTIAKQRNEYCIIDENDNFIKSLKPNYKDVRSFRDGYATMKDISGHWGAIDYQGNEIIPCKYDSQVIFDKNGIAEVKLNNQIFRIDVNDNIIVNF